MLEESCSKSRRISRSSRNVMMELRRIKRKEDMSKSAGGSADIEPIVRQEQEQGHKKEK